jgi:hypothetical protein
VSLFFLLSLLLRFLQDQSNDEWNGQNKKRIEIELKLGFTKRNAKIMAKNMETSQLFGRICVIHAAINKHKHRNLCIQV